MFSDQIFVGAILSTPASYHHIFQFTALVLAQIAPARTEEKPSRSRHTTSGLAAGAEDARSIAQLRHLPLLVWYLTLIQKVRVGMAAFCTSVRQLQFD